MRLFALRSMGAALVLASSGAAAQQQQQPFPAQPFQQPLQPQPQPVQEQPFQPQPFPAGPNGAAGETLDAFGLEAPAPLEDPIFKERAPDEPWLQGAVASLRVVDLGNGETLDLTLSKGQKASAFRLSVAMEYCSYKPLGYQDEAAARLVLRDEGLEGELVFEGWLFSAAPAVSGVNHPRYDVWRRSCSAASAEES